MHAAHVYDVLHTALQSCQVGRNVAKQIILTTNEDRDHVETPLMDHNIIILCMERKEAYYAAQQDACTDVVKPGHIRKECCSAVCDL